MSGRIKMFLRRVFNTCDHEFVTLSNYYGDYIYTVSTRKRIIRRSAICLKCKKIEYFEELDPKCKVINDNQWERENKNVI